MGTLSGPTHEYQGARLATASQAAHQQEGGMRNRPSLEHRHADRLLDIVTAVPKAHLSMFNTQLY